MSNNFDFCPVCGNNEMGREIITRTFEYKGNSLTIPNFVLYTCPRCKETFHDKTQFKDNERRIRDFQRETDELLTSEEIKHIRCGLGFTQEKFGDILGGGAKAFARYETGTVTQSRPMDNLLRVIWHYPVSINALIRKSPVKTKTVFSPVLRYDFEKSDAAIEYKMVDVA